MLENEIEFEQEDLEQTVKFYEAMGGYCPTMGIVGAVFGLIHAMGLLDAPEVALKLLTHAAGLHDPFKAGVTAQADEQLVQLL